MRKLCLAMLLGCGLLATGAHAAQGTLSARNLSHGGCAIAAMSVKYKIGSLMGEPTVNGAFQWQAGTGTPPDCLSYAVKVYLQIRPRSGTGTTYVKLDPTVPASGKGYGMNVTGSPNWDRMFCGVAGGQCLSADRAKALYKSGFDVVGFRLSGGEADAAARLTRARAKRDKPSAAASSVPSGSAGVRRPVSLIGVWQLQMRPGNPAPVQLNFKPDGTATYHAVNESDYYPAKWRQSGSRVTVEAFGTMYHFRRNEPAIRLNLVVDGDRMTGEQVPAAVRSRRFVVEEGHKL